MTDKFDSDRYCTPPEALEPVLTMWPSGIELDPCWDPDGVVSSRFQFDIRDGHDGLTMPWADVYEIDAIRTVFCNPPYSDPGEWPAKAVRECGLSKILETICLVPATTDVAWWHEWVIPHASAICYVRGRYKHLKEGKPHGCGRGGSAFVYIVSDELRGSRKVDRFRRVFGVVGHVEVLDG